MRWLTRPKWTFHRATCVETQWKHAYVFVHIVVNEINVNVVFMMLRLVADKS
jgi:hypothetical protein